MEMIDVFKGILIMSLFYSFSISTLTHYLPDEALNHITMFSESEHSFTFDSMSTEIEDSIQSQIDLPLVELGVLVFYSGNILIDMLLNFIFALPEMAGFLIAGVFYLFPSIPAYIKTNISIFSTSIFMLLYMVGIIQLLTNIRATGKVI